MKEPVIFGSQAQVTAKLENSVSIRSENICSEQTEVMGECMFLGGEAGI